MGKLSLKRVLQFVVAGLLLPSFAYAHLGVGEASGFMHGLTHPTGGLDHVCAMLARERVIHAAGAGIALCGVYLAVA
jgi:hydrogenase/urease accessory protein HupE